MFVFKMKLQTKILLITLITLIGSAATAALIKIFTDDTSLILSLILPLLIMMGVIITTVYFKCPHCGHNIKSVFVGSRCSECNKKY
jgi:hypothetical protein